ncbi:hypothetical protein K437DRAFT_848 [Tilletiaria anomala UBC 951]|uniref:Lipocalin-like domain-containing protein n=1 Tax=Tilletiaria anomala (strain ATCC 24038 / CBS 436.72 / UBC 951) TaxID=1037660 RepID=A0A066WI65_TILAU|nr:uncharacterized protein K437DRAFT_848 [Tilletiaria anomala UBC 951]KDN53526.1 hypothetical protein K437DRAFT_848 [Tilletiaria anomala UBC 951]
MEHHQRNVEAPKGPAILGQLVGAWSLKNAKAHSAHREFSMPLGSRPQGLLIYSDDGYVTASIEADSDAPEAAPSTVLYTGPIELTHPSAMYMDYEGCIPDAVSLELVQSALREEELGTVLVKELKINGEGAHRTLTVRTTSTWPQGTQHEPVTLTLTWQRNQSLSP